MAKSLFLDTQNIRQILKNYKGVVDLDAKDEGGSLASFFTYRGKKLEHLPGYGLANGIGLALYILPMGLGGEFLDHRLDSWAKAAKISHLRGFVDFCAFWLFRAKEGEATQRIDLAGQKCPGSRAYFSNGLLLVNYPGPLRICPNKFSACHEWIYFAGFSSNELDELPPAIYLPKNTPKTKAKNLA